MTLQEIEVIHELVSSDRSKLQRQKKRIAPHNVVELSLIENRINMYSNIIVQLGDMYSSQSKSNTNAKGTAKSK